MNAREYRKYKRTKQNSIKRKKTKNVEKDEIERLNKRIEEEAPERGVNEKKKKTILK